MQNAIEPDGRSDNDARYLELRNVTKSYGQKDQVAVNNLSLSLDKGEFVSLLGPSGCGKTTTLRLLAGLIEPDSGQIIVDKEEITFKPVHKRQMGVVFQQYALFPNMTVFDNVAFGLKMKRVDKHETISKVGEMLELVHLGDYGQRKIRELSGGQQQRVALARALVIDPAVLLLDEPLSNLDAKLRVNMRDEIRSIQRHLGITTVFVTHDQSEALAMSDRVAVMNHGAIDQISSPVDVYRAPATRFVADFIGRANFLDGKVLGQKNGNAIVEIFGIGTVEIPQDYDGVSAVQVMVRPHDLVIHSQGEKRRQNEKVPLIDARVRNVAYTGESAHYSLDLGTQTLDADVPVGQTPLSMDDDIKIELHPAKMRIFPQGS